MLPENTSHSGRNVGLKEKFGKWVDGSNVGIQSFPRIGTLIQFEKYAFECKMAENNDSCAEDSTSEQSETYIDLHLLDLECDTIIHISTFLDRISHFSVLSNVCKSMNDLFSYRLYFNAMNAKPDRNLQMIDCRLFESNIGPLLSKDKTTLLVNSKKLYSIRPMQRRNHINRKRKFNDTTDDRIESDIFPTHLKTIHFNAVLNKKVVKWIANLLQNSCASSPIKEWNLSKCALTNEYLSMISGAILNRSHLSNLSSIDISQNISVSDHSVTRLFTALGEKCPKIRKVDLRFTNVSDLTCVNVATFLIKYIDFGTVNIETLVNVLWSQTRVTTNGELQFSEMISDATKPGLGF